MTRMTVVNRSPKLTQFQGQMELWGQIKGQILLRREIQDLYHSNHPQQEHPQQQVEPFSPLFFCPPVSLLFEANRCFALNIWAIGYYFNISHQCLLLCLALSASFLRLRGHLPSVLKPLFGFIQHLSLLAALYFFVLASFSIV